MIKKEYCGIGISNGECQGHVKVVKSAEDLSSVKKGDILVVHSSSPDLTIALLNADGVISEAGGVLCHIGIIAREIGIPAVVNIENIMENLKDGDLVSLNGNTGVVNVYYR